MKTSHLGLAALLIALTLSAAGAESSRESTNSIGIPFTRIDAGSFEMGVDSTPLPMPIPKGMSGVSYDRQDGNGDYDEVPVHRVAISKPFLIGTTEVTIEQFKQFKPDYAPSDYWAPYAAGVSWNEAVAFCEWLSKKEGKPYRLPTEAEWEYVCRAGTRTPFSHGMTPDDADLPNQWGVKNMQAAVAEWCADWHGKYSADAQTDPVGAEAGLGKIVRGGGMDYRKSEKNDGVKRMPIELMYYRRSANRASAPPDFSSSKGHIGFRVVQADMPATKPLPVEPLFFQTAIKQQAPDLTAGPDMSKPYYRQREMFPNLGERSMRDVGWKIGFAPALGQAYHNSAVQMCSNGDLIAAYYNTLKWEDDADQTVLVMRLRFGADEWDAPEPWPDFADAADAAPIFWNDDSKEHAGRMWMFFGSPRIPGGPPFHFMWSLDNGATWTPVRTPHILGPVGGFESQPVNSIIHANGSIYVPIDGAGADTGLFATSDDGQTWRDTGGRTGGRHTSFVLGKDGSFIGYGGKNSNIENMMPLSVSTDGGKSYVKTKTEFGWLGGGQRPSVIRLLSGKLFFVADKLSSRLPGGRTASFCALSEDEGKTWTRRDLPINSTCGYVTATQTPNGVIHIVTSKTLPVRLHVELNEQWVLNGGDATPDDTKVRDTKSFKETYASGKPKAEWSGGIGDDGNWRLDGPQVFFYESGAKQWESTYVAGKRTGTETLWGADGKKKWERVFGPDGAWTWRILDRGGKTVAESKWKAKSLLEVGSAK